MKKLLFFVCIFTMCIMTLAGCGTDLAEGSKKANEDAIKVVTTIYPLYDWVRNIAPDAEITLLLDNGVDLHNYQPSVSDIMKISDADIFVYVGGESDDWVDGVFDQIKIDSKIMPQSDATKADDYGFIQVNLMDVIGNNALEEELAEGMQGEEESEEDGDEGPELDEHVWLSLKNAQICCQTIEKALEKTDPEHSQEYWKNFTDYSAKLDALDQKFNDLTKDSQITLLFGDRFPFRYFVNDYGITYYAAFMGCSAETEASFETILFLAGKVRDLSLDHVCMIEGSDGKIARTIIQESGRTADVITFYSMQSVFRKDLTSESYLYYMEKNLEALKSALK